MLQHPLPIRLALLYGILFWLGLLYSLWIYHAGLQNGFYLYDDYPNLSRLELIDETDLWNELGRFITEGISGFMGRPVALATFAAQFYQFPTNISAFKTVNYLLHLLNACLLFWLLIRLAPRLSLTPNRSFLFAFLLTIVWLLHPLNVSTVLYIIQRMTELAAFFTLLGLLLYVIGREHLHTHRLFSGYTLIIIGISAGLLFGTLSKENGALLVLYIWIIEITLLRNLHRPRYFTAVFATGVILPSLLIAAYFIFNFPSIYAAYATREFTFAERILTQPLILIDYLTKILLIEPTRFGLFHDDFPMSQSLFSPPTTIIAIIFLASALFLAISQYKRLIIFSFAILWFFAGHLLESTIIPLLFYFEHRNYLPMIGILFGILYGAFKLYDYVSQRFESVIIPYFTLSIYLIWLLLIPILTAAEVALWANPALQAAYWAQRHPQSRQAQAHAAGFFIRITPEALRYHQTIVERFPETTAGYSMWLSATCINPELPPPALPAVLRQFETTRIDIATVNSLHNIVEKQADNECKLISPDEVNTLLRAAIANPQELYLPELYHIYANFLGAQGRYTEAIEMANNSLKSKYNVTLILQKIIWLQWARRDPEALALIQTVQTTASPAVRHLYAARLAHAEEVIRDRLAGKPTPLPRAF